MLAKDGAPAADAGNVSLVNLNEIDFGPAAKVRAKLDDKAVRRYADALKRKKKFPPLLLVRVNGKLYCVDGRHRAEAFKLRNVTMVLCRIIDGTDDDVVRLALKSNVEHGLRRTRDDKRSAVEWAAAQYPDASVRELARMCEVSRQFVRKMRVGVVNVDHPSMPEPAPVSEPEVAEVQAVESPADRRGEIIRGTVPVRPTAPPRYAAAHQNSPPKRDTTSRVEPCELDREFIAIYRDAHQKICELVDSRLKQRFPQWVEYQKPGVASPESYKALGADMRNAMYRGEDVRKALGEIRRRYSTFRAALGEAF